MAQNYTEQLRKDNVRDAIYEDLQNNCEVLRTSWSGNAFPANPKVGQPCYRVDEDKLYYWDGYKWSQKGGGGSAELKTMELAAATSERVSITLEGARCLDKNMMFVFIDKIAQDPSTYSMNDDGTVVNFNPAIPANAAVTLRWFDTDVGTFDTAIFASDAEFAAGELTNRAPNVKQVHSLSDMVASKLSGLELMDVGFAPLGIDESKNKRRYLNGQVIIQSQFPAFTAAVKARMSTMANAFTTEENWQAEKTNSKLGQCGKFVVDDTAGTIRLPCVVNAQGLLSLSGIGNLVNESLPNITGKLRSVSTADSDASGAFYYIKPPSGQGLMGSDPGILKWNSFAGLNASLSSSTYQNNAPVQQEAVQYPYYIQVATGVEETLPAIREYNINTPFFFGQSMYSDVAPDNASWLASNGQYNARSVYPDYYDWLVEQMNAGVDGFKGTTAYQFKGNTAETEAYVPSFTTRNPVVGSAIYGGSPIQVLGHATQVNADGSVIVQDVVNNITVTLVFKQEIPNIHWFTDYDFAINTADQTFRLPLKNGSEDLQSNKHEILTYTSDKTYVAPANGWFSCYGVSTAASASSYNLLINQTTGERDTKYSVSSNNRLDVSLEVSRGQSVYALSQNFTIEDFRFIYAKGNGSLYYYVGDTVQDASLINAGAVLGQLANVNAASRGYLVDSYHNGTEWYRIYSDGWVEQGGVVSSPATDSSNSVSLLRGFTDTNYSLLVTENGTTINDHGSGNFTCLKRVSSFQLYNNGYGYSGHTVNWFACGY